MVPVSSSRAGTVPVWRGPDSVVRGGEGRVRSPDGGDPATRPGAGCGVPAIRGKRHLGTSLALFDPFWSLFGRPGRKGESRPRFDPVGGVGSVARRGRCRRSVMGLQPRYSGGPFARAASRVRPGANAVGVGRYRWRGSPPPRPRGRHGVWPRRSEPCLRAWAAAQPLLVAQCGVRTSELEQDRLPSGFTPAYAGKPPRSISYGQVYPRVCGVLQPRPWGLVAHAGLLLPAWWRGC